MSRKIKFRAWDKKMNRMFSIDNAKGSLALYFSYTTRSYKKGNEFINRFIQMQFTGLKDKNKTDVYEGDIIELLCGIGVVKIGKCAFQTYGDNDQHTSVCTYIEYANGNTDILTYNIIGNVIGNIYNNPELLNS